MPAKPIRSYGSRGSLGPQYPYTQDQLYSIPGTFKSLLWSVNVFV